MGLASRSRSCGTLAPYSCSRNRRCPCLDYKRAECSGCDEAPDIGLVARISAKAIFRIYPTTDFRFPFCISAGHHRAEACGVGIFQILAQALMRVSMSANEMRTIR
jgi:hypothetical protein